MQGCVYGYVYDANTGNSIDQATVSVIKGTCSGTGCGAGTVTEQTDTAGFYTFDAYGNIHGASNTKIILLASGEESITFSVSKFGYYSRTVYHRPDYEEVTNDGQDYLITDMVPVYLCPWFSPDSDGDSICNAAELEYGTDPFSSDTDGDRLSDAAELFGSDGVDLRYFGADPLRKDLFIEADYYPGLKPAQAAIDQVVAAFANAPVSNPDGSTGITLHVDLNQQIAAADADMNLSPVWTDFDIIKNKYFKSRRDKLFHYALFANQYNGGTSSGISRGIPAHDFIVSLGAWPTPGGTVQQQAGTLMHEFGHNLGLRHGGNENANYKPNYFSVMSYFYQMPGLTIGGVSGQLDFSSVQVGAINENTLNEVLAFSAVAPTTEADLAQYSVLTCSGTPSGTASSNLDINGNGVIEWAWGRDITCDGDLNDSFIASQNDWDNLVFDGAGTIGDGMLGVDVLGGVQHYQVTSEDDVEPCMTPDDLIHNHKHNHNHK